MENVLTRAELREELHPINEKIDRFGDRFIESDILNRERMAKIEGRLEAVEQHPNTCPARQQIENLRVRAISTEEKVNALQVSVAKALGYMTGAGVVGGTIVGFAIKLFT